MFHHESMHKHGKGHGSCCSCGPEHRHFISKKEKKERMEEYREQLQQEIDGVTEAISDLEKK
jgi:hypothetical protein